MQTPGQPRFSRRSKLAAFFGLKRNLVILLITIFVIGAGEELWMRFVPKYLQALGATVFVIGLYDALRTLLGAVYAYPGGVIVDHWGHRRAFIPVNGRAQIAQRFAIDWARLNADGKTFTGDAKDNKNYRAYGSDALAVADGVVTEIKDGIPENVPGINSRAVPITLETIGGNHVVLDIGHGRYAFYAHLQPGSLKVKLGDHVKRGQVLGLVGNSGNSTEPHLHFHLSNGNSPLGSEGIPYALESFEAKRKEDAPLSNHHMEIPTENEIMTFADK